MFGEAQTIAVKPAQAERYSASKRPGLPTVAQWAEHAAAAKAAAKAIALVSPDTIATVTGVDLGSRINAIYRMPDGTYDFIVMVPTGRHMYPGIERELVLGYTKDDVYGVRTPPAYPPAGLLNQVAVTCYGGADYLAPRASADSPVLDAILRLKDGWDGEGSVAPPDAAKASVADVCSHLSHFMPAAEPEIDPSTGEVSFSWYFDDHTASVSVTVLPSGRIVLVAARLGQPTRRQVFEPHEIARLNRAALGFGLNRVDA